MAEIAVLKHLRDRTGARNLLDMLSLGLGRALPLLSKDERVFVLSDGGFWILSEAVKARPAASHSVEYVPFKKVDRVQLQTCDEARDSEYAAERLRSVVVTVTCRRGYPAEPAQLMIEGDVLVQAIQHDEDADRLWDIVISLIRQSSEANVPVSVIATVP